MQTKNLIRWAVGLLALAGAAAAIAAGPGVSIDQIQQAAQGDRATKMLKDIFGDIAQNPFSAGNSPMAQAFVMLNSSALVIGVLWFSYTLGAGIVQTAHDGEFLGKRYSSVWLPVRFSIGIGSLVPVFGGYSLAQALMLWAAASGIGIANLTTNAVAGRILDGKSMVSQPHAAAPEQAVEAVFRSAVCMHATNQALAASYGNDSGKTLSAYDMIKRIQVGPSAYTFGTQAPGRAPGVECGTVSIAQIEPNMSNRAPTNDPISEPLKLAHRSAFIAMVDEVDAAAEKYTIAALQFDTATGEKRYPDVGVPASTLAEIATKYEKKINSTVASLFRQISGADKKILLQIQNEGWSSLGIWYQTFAVINERMATAAAISIETRAPVESAALPGDPKYWSAMRQRLENPAHQEVSREAINDAYNTASAGQWITEKIIKGINWSSSTSGGGQIVNPMIGAKNLGDSVLITGQVILGVYVGGIISGETGKHLPLIGKVPETIKEILKGLSWIFALAAVTLFFFGFMLSVYLPMLPFIIWFGSMMAWIAIVAESVIAAPLWAMMHLDGEGDGMGQRTGHGYLFLLNVLFRPALMVLGFFLATMIVTIMGQYLNQMFFGAMANAQQNGSTGASWTGLVSIIGFLAIYISLMLTLVHGAFNLIQVVPDQVLGWLGGHMGTQLGKDAEQSSNKVFGGVGGAGGSGTSGEIQTIRRRRGEAGAGLPGDVKTKIEQAKNSVDNGASGR